METIQFSELQFNIPLQVASLWKRTSFVTTGST